MRQTLHGQRARLGAFEDLVHVRGQLSSRFAATRAIREQATAVPIAADEEGWQPMPDRQFSDPASMLDGRGHFQDQYSLGLSPVGGLEGAFQVGAGPSNPQRLSLETNRPRLLLIPGSGRFRRARNARVSQERHPGQPRDRLLEHFQMGSHFPADRSW
jgi:hypothetical protein